jgi:CRP/FNR family transcriptional regulator
VYAVRYGSFKHCRQDRTGARKITGFPMGGDFLALDSIGLARHECTALALEDSEVCEISYGAMREQAMFFQRIISQSIFNMQAISLQLRRTTAEQRLAGFLLNMATRYSARGYSCTRYRLPMSRQDIAAYLNLTPESVSRLLREFRQGHLIRTDHREMELLDPAALKVIIAGATSHAA